MHRNVTALYRTGETAERVRLALEEIGIPAHDIHVVPDGVHDLASRTPAADTSVTGARPTDGTTGASVTGAGSGIAPTGTPVTPREHPLHDAGMLEAGAEPDIDRLYDLHLPDDDLRTYQHAIREGDYVVSAEVDDNQLERVKEIMRRPETEIHNIEHRALEFRNHDLIAHSAGNGRHALSEEYRARRLDNADEDGLARIYERDRRLDRR